MKAIKFILYFMLTGLFFLVLLPGMNGQTEVIRKFQFKKVKGVTIEILSANAFERQFGTNRLVPRSDVAVLDLARRLYGPDKGYDEECGEDLNGALFAALANPEIKDETRTAVDNLMDEDKPNLEKLYTCNHFNIYYTTSSTQARDNITLADAQATCQVLDNAWNSYAVDFTEPKHYLSGGGCAPQKKMIDVFVYDLGTTLYGETSSSWNFINLNSAEVATNACRRQTTPVHELFHRVQYAYGYISGTADMKWAVEGTASWSQKYMANNVGDWMNRMNSGLNAPDKDLIKNRSYDACHLWAYLAERGNDPDDSIDKAWSTHSTNGKKMKEATDKAIKDHVSSSSDFDQFVTAWHMTNFIKDLSNAVAANDYEEDEWTRTCGGTTFGPLTTVPVTGTALISKGTTYQRNNSVAAYGADYWVFNLDTDEDGNGVLTGIEINVNLAGNGGLGFGLLEIKGNDLVKQQTDIKDKTRFNYTRQFKPGYMDRVVLIVMGITKGGEYSVSVKGTHGTPST